MQTDNLKQAQNAYKAISYTDPKSIVSEQYRKLRTNIELSNFDQELKVIALTSTLSGEGKTITSINLATVYGQSNKKTLLIDMDLRKPKIHRGFKLSNKQGLSDIITKDIKKEAAITEITPYLDVLTSGSKLPFPAELLMSDQLSALMEDLRNDYDRIIIDTPPMAAVTDANIISTFVDGMILVVASRKTNIDVAKDVLKVLRENDATVIGCVFTRVRKKDHFYAYYYNDKYEEQKT